MKHIVLFGAGKSSIFLIDYLIAQLLSNQWRLTVLDSNLDSVLQKTGEAPNTFAAYIDVSDEEQRRKWIAESDVVISLMPPSLHHLIAIDCLSFGKNLLTASYVDERMKNLNESVKEKGLLFLCECGLDPGIDHMSAMKIIHSLRNEGAEITAFRSHCGGLVAPESDNNPWRYKISWNPRNIVLAGKAGAVFKENGEIKRLGYEDLFGLQKVVEVDDLSAFAWYPNRDSLSYMDAYDLHTANTFIRTTLRYPEFCMGWKNVIDLKLTDEEPLYDTDGLSLKGFFQQHMHKHGFSAWLEKHLTTRFMQTKLLLEKLEELLDAEGNVDEVTRQELEDFMLVDPSGNLQNINVEDVKTSAAATVAMQMHEANVSMKQLFFLGMDDGDTIINKGKCSAADVLQFSLEKKLALADDDKDMVVMLHEIEYKLRNKDSKIKSALIVKGENAVRTAMAKTVGLPLGIAAKLVLQEKIKLTGVQIPLLPEIYEPILQELRDHGIRFDETEE